MTQTEHDQVTLFGWLFTRTVTPCSLSRHHARIPAGFKAPYDLSWFSLSKPLQTSFDSDSDKRMSHTWVMMDHVYIHAREHVAPFIDWLVFGQLLSSCPMGAACSPLKTQVPPLHHSTNPNIKKFLHERVLLNDSSSYLQQTLD